MATAESHCLAPQTDDKPPSLSTASFGEREEKPRSVDCTEEILSELIANTSWKLSVLGQISAWVYFGIHLKTFSIFSERTFLLILACIASVAVVHVVHLQGKCHCDAATCKLPERYSVVQDNYSLRSAKLVLIGDWVTWCSSWREVLRLKNAFVMEVKHIFRVIISFYRKKKKHQLKVWEVQVNWIT